MNVFVEKLRYGVDVLTRRLVKCVKHSFTRMVFNMSGSITASRGFLSSYALHTGVIFLYNAFNNP